jgi:hypothetical protein
MPGAQCTRSLACAGVVNYAREYSQRRYRKLPAFPTQWLYSFLRAVPGDRAFLPPSSATIGASQARLGSARSCKPDLTPASGHQDHTASPSATLPLVLHAALAHDWRRPAITCAHDSVASTASRRVRDDRDTPLGGTARSIAAIRISENQNIFSYGTGQPKSHQI